MATEVSRPLVFINTDVNRTTRKVRRCVDTSKVYPQFQETLDTASARDIVTVVDDSLGEHPIVIIF